MVVRIMVIVNPVSGMGRGARCGKIIATARENLDIFFTTPARTAFKLAQEAVQDKYERVIGVGGDGTISEIANGLLGSGIPLAIIPAGIGNDFSKGAGIPQNTRKALEVALSGQLLPVDLGRINGKIFVNVVSFGFDAQLVRHIPALREKYYFLPGVWLYLIAFYRELFYGPDWPEISVRFPERARPRVFSKQTTALVVSNGPQYAKMFNVAPGASLVDGLLDICWIEAINRMKLLVNLPKVLQGTHVEIPEVSTLRAPSLSITARGIACQVDGEVFEADEGEYLISVVPKALNVVTPVPSL